MLSERFLQWEREFLDRGRREGWQNGREEGREEGRREGIQPGVCQLLTLLLRRRLGELPESVQAGLRKASAEELELWSPCLLAATSVDDVRACIEMLCAAS